jgi:hypothetical protein
VRSDQLGVGVTLESVPVSAVPVHVETLARTYVGDLEYALVREARNRDLFLVARGVAWRLNVPALLASFADELRQWDRQRELMLGIRETRVGTKPRAVKTKRAS